MTAGAAALWTASALAGGPAHAQTCSHDCPRAVTYYRRLCELHDPTGCSYASAFQSDPAAPAQSGPPSPPLRDWTH